MQIICTSLQTDNHASTTSPKFFTGRMLSLMPSQQCQRAEGCSDINLDIFMNMWWYRVMYFDDFPVNLQNFAK